MAAGPLSFAATRSYGRAAPHISQPLLASALVYFTASLILRLISTDIYAGISLLIGKYVVTVPIYLKPHFSHICFRVVADLLVER